MAKTNKTEQYSSVKEQTAITEPVLETGANTTAPELPKHKKEKREEIALRYGQCIIAPAGNEDDEILTTIDDWNSLYNTGANQGRFILKAEKKSS